MLRLSLSYRFKLDVYKYNRECFYTKHLKNFIWDFTSIISVKITL